jgi:hypothetical protein
LLRGVRPIGDWSISITLSQIFEAGDLVMRARDHPRAVERARGPGMQRVDGEAGLAEPETPVTQVNVPKRKAGADVP